MTTERERILELVAAGKLSPGDADRLLQRGDGTSRRAVLAWLLDPIDRLGTRRALVVGLVAVGCGLALAAGLGVRFDGAFDTHLGQPPIPLRLSLADAAVAWPLSALVFWAVSLAFARQGRLVDHLAAVGLARVPVLITGAVLGIAATLWPPAPDAKLPISPGITVAVIATLPVIAWQFVLLYRGFRTASGLRGVRCAIAAFVAIAGAEVASKAALTLLP